jgi:2TM domain-containing protein
MKQFNQDDAYFRAKYKVERIRRFYKHLAIYIIVVAFVFGIKIVKHMTHGESFFEAITSINIYGIWLFWGIGLTFHAFAVFGTDYFLGKNWEENKMKQFMQEDEENFKSNN